MQRHVIGLFHFALRPERWLFLGSAENIDNTSALFENIDVQAHIYRARHTAAASQYRVEWIRSSPSVRPRDATPVGAEHGDDRLSDLVPRLLNDLFAPPGVITNRRFETLYLHGELGDFLCFPSGPHSNNFLQLARQGLQGRLRRVVLDTLDNAGETAVQPARILHNGQYLPVVLQAREIHLGAGRPSAVLVNFLAAGSTPESAATHAAAPRRPNSTPRQKRSTSCRALARKLPA